MQDFIIVKVPVRVARNGSREILLNAITSRVHAAVRDWCEMELPEYAPGGVDDEGDALRPQLHAWPTSEGKP